MPSIDEKLIVGLSRVVAALQRPLMKHISAAGFTPGQFAVLEALLHKGPRTVNDLIEDVLSSSGNISVVIDNLLKAGLLEKKSVPEDGRKRVIHLSSLGEEKIHAYYPLHKAELTRLLGGIDTPTKRALVRSLLMVRNEIENASSAKTTKGYNK